MDVTQINLGRCSVNVGPDALALLQEDLTSVVREYSQIFMLCDTNTLKDCLPELLSKVPALRNAEPIEVPAGEQSKDLQVCEQVWTYLQSKHADRDALLVALGGGVVTDLGGFIAATYKRGIRSISIPTTLMGQVDASIGGKTGIDLAGVKNMVGVFHDPQGIYVHIPFLRTLNKRELLNGLAEMVKHGLVKEEDHFKEIQNAELHRLVSLEPLIMRSIKLKAQVVLEDPTETGLRKMLNFGHTIGHALESHSWETQKRELLHGEAIAVGMICESWLSHRMEFLSLKEHERISSYLMSIYPTYDFHKTDDIRLLNLMQHDKKNQKGAFRFTLLEGIGNAVINVEVSKELVMKAFEAYRELRRGQSVE